MAVYASTADFREYTRDEPGLADIPADEAVERLLRRAEERVDAALGPWPIYSSGRKIDPGSLDVSQREALKRATCAAAEHELFVGLDYLAGSEDYAPPGVTPLRQPLRTSPRMLEELAGHGLIRYSGTVAASPEPPPVPPSAVSP